MTDAPEPCPNCDAKETPTNIVGQCEVCSIIGCAKCIFRDNDATICRNCEHDPN